MAPRATLQPSRRMPDAGRVVGIAAAIIANVALDGGLELPPSPAPVSVRPEADDYLHWVIVPHPVPRPIVF